VTHSAYVDTSAFAKWYLNEARSDDVEAFIRARHSVAVSRLTAVELRCLLARRRRNREIDGRTERRVLETFESDVRQGFVAVHPLEDRHALAAYGLLTRLARHSLRTLDALHLAIALDVDARVLATADAVMAAAAKALGMTVESFH
jgi:predicted nucleic acid-binding protein